MKFEKLFPTEATTESVVRWIPRADWGCPSDPSGRAQKVHSAAYNGNTHLLNEEIVIAPKEAMVIIEDVVNSLCTTGTRVA